LLFGNADHNIIGRFKYGGALLAEPVLKHKPFAFSAYRAAAILTGERNPVIMTVNTKQGDKQ
jgi:hypothetical protein